ncbi:hypothetical protein BDV95DRAFT_304573 [Massariosphaeria phaeospora]|uniref:Uncharacterized protein n=1 Tax=Massariosphaeria phaeospora TaxID=100035 RepID=A0A7C8MF06_9PLEO|nr:hypothetical protein BDV95DRAFT_304573 [Massariosphaeria phaeospora]
MPLCLALRSCRIRTCCEEADQVFQLPTRLAARGEELVRVQAGLFVVTATMSHTPAHGHAAGEFTSRRATQVLNTRLGHYFGASVARGWGREEAWARRDRQPTHQRIKAGRQLSRAHAAGRDFRLLVNVIAAATQGGEVHTTQRAPQLSSPRRAPGLSFAASASAPTAD